MHVSISAFINRLIYLDSSDAHLLRQISQSGPPSPGSANMPNQERIMQLFAEAMDESRNQTRAADSLLEQDHDLITQVCILFIQLIV